MKMAAGSIVVDLLMKTGSFETDTKRAEKRLKELQKTAVEAGKMIAGAFTVVTTATAVLVKAQIDAADEMGKAASKAGVTTESLSALAYAAELSGSSQEEMTQALGKLSRQMSEAAAGGKTAQEAFKSIGISVTDASGKMKTSDQVFKEIADRFAAMPDGVAKTNAAIEIFGRAGANLIPTLNEGSEGLKNFADEAQRLGIIVDGDAAAAAAEFNDNITRLQKTAAGFGMTIANQVLPQITRLSEEMMRVNGGTGLAELAGKAFNVVLQTVAVLAANVAFVLSSIGREIGGIAAQLTAIARLDFKGFSFIGQQMRADAAAARAELDAFERRMMGGAAPAGGGRGNIIPPLAIPGASGGGFTPSSKPDKKALDAAKKEAEAYDDWMQQMREGELDRYVRMLDQQDAALKKSIEDQKKEEEAYQEWMREMQGAEHDRYYDMLAQREDAAKKTQDLAKELGLTFTSAFEDAIAGGKSLGEVLRGLEQDIIRLITRKLVTEPLGNMFTSWLGSVIPGFGGARATGGDVIGGRAYLVGENGPEMFVPRTTGTVVPNTSRQQTQRAGNVINVNVTAVQGMTRDTALQQGQRIAQGLQLAMMRNG